ncbi:MAG TPA: HAD-IB family phosphatase, partial [Methanomassiliicoccales archaeon]|nr:HAD-IB family phosphatase [Methanomassiliicoccales archaeon]
MGFGRKESRAIVCDFDGTITLLDTAEFLLETFAEGDWRAPDRQLVKGEIDLEECMKRQVAMVHVDPDTMMRALDGRVGIRKGLSELVDRCSANDVPFHIASAGLDFVIVHYLKKAGVLDEVEIHALESKWNGRQIDLAFPPLRNEGARSFKQDVVLDLRKKGRKVVYIGDGLSDLDGARAADL